ncbi:MAG TPA: MotA/TolQ/ExbB proton channel family protein [Xanthomonadales bacterium]|nr:MotA/TolQ/ExbB proton channel family protein [Xanthomonadales bacterium]
MFTSLLQQIAEYLQDGGWVMPPLLIGTVVMWFAIGYRFAALKRGTKRGVRNLLARAEQGKQASDDGIMVRALQKGLALKATAAGPNLRPLLDDAFWEEERDLGKYNVLITTIVLAAPLLGLLGTVIGMIETFDSLGDMSLFSQSGGIAGGIAQALITTQMGLAVAIPGLIGNGALNRRAKAIELELAQMKDMLCTDMIAGGN